MAFETRYDVSTHVDSSAPAERFPEMCGSATLAIEVSRTSMNVARVTVTATTQGLIDPSGILNFDMILFNIVLIVPASSVLSTYNLGAVYLYSILYLVITVAPTFIPGRNTALSAEIGSSTIFTGMRCTTFT
jgi:hypothetical protein